MDKLVWIFFLFGGALGASFDILEPPKKGIEAALLFVPERLLEGNAYKPLAEAIQQESPLALWCVLLNNFKNKMASGDELSHVFSSVRTTLQNKGMNSSIIFIAGHGSGGIAVAQFLQDNYLIVNGSLLYGTKVPSDLNLRDYLVPTFTISGDLDGVIRITKMLHMYDNTESEGDYRTPFIVLPGVNHGQFASGDLPDFIKDNDLPSEFNNTQALQVIAEVTSAAMTSIIYQPTSAVENATKTMKNHMSKSREFLDPLIKTQKMIRDDQSVSQWSINVQIALVGIESRELRVDNQVVDDEKLVANNPSMEDFDSSLYAGTFSSLTMEPTSKDALDAPVASLQLQTKMVSKQSMKEYQSSQTFDNLTLTCNELNQLAYEYAVSITPLEVVGRFSERRKKIFFHEDKIAHNQLQWVLTKLAPTPSVGDLHLTSTRFEMGGIYDPNSKRNISVVACNLLTPFRALEWIYIDSLKR